MDASWTIGLIVSRWLLPAMLGLIGCTQGIAWAATYRWVDAQGQVHYGQAPPPTSKTEKLASEATELPAEAAGGYWWRRDGDRLYALEMRAGEFKLYTQDVGDCVPRGMEIAWGPLQQKDGKLSAKYLGQREDAAWLDRESQYDRVATAAGTMELRGPGLLGGRYSRLAGQTVVGGDALAGRWRDGAYTWVLDPRNGRFQLLGPHPHKRRNPQLAEGNWARETSPAIRLFYVVDHREGTDNHMQEEETWRLISVETSRMRIERGGVVSELSRVW